MFDWIIEIPHISQNLFCGALGAILIAFYQIYSNIPDIEAILSNVSSKKNPTTNSSFTVIFKILSRVIISIGCAAFVSAFLVRPQESYGAIITGMTWTTVVKNLTQDKK